METMNITINSDSISAERKAEIQPLIDYLKTKVDLDETIHLNFICTHNSRRSQLSQIWALIAANENDIDIYSYSGGVEVTAFNHRAVDALVRQGIEFEVKDADSENPMYIYRNNGKKLKMFSKLFDDDINPNTNFAAIMTCSHADENCPFIPGANARIPLRYEDPKAFDDMENEQEKYMERSEQIANEMFYIFSSLK